MHVTKVDVVPTETPDASTRTKNASLPAWFPFLYVLFAALLTLPILLPKYPPLVDYPNNLSRADILSRYSTVVEFQNIYAIQHEPIANLAIDLVVPPIARAIGILAAGKTFLVLVLAIYALGCYLLARVTQNGTPWIALLLLLFFYNTAVTTGFMNYIAGVAIYLVTFACWLRWSGCWSPRRVIGFAVLAVCCYFAHLSSIAALGISVFAVSCWEYSRGRMSAASTLLSATGFILPGILFLIFMRGPGQIGTIRWNTLAGKIQDLPLVVRTYNLRLDIAMLVIALVCIFLWVRAASGVAVHSVTAIGGLSLLACFVFSPKDLFTSNAVDLRFVWPATVLVTVAFRPLVPSRRATTWLAVLILLWTIRAGVMWSVWEDLGNRIEQMVNVFHAMPRGVTLYPVAFAASDFDTAKRDWALRHVACYAVMEQDAFVPSVTAIAAQQPLVYRSRLPPISWDPTQAGSWRGYDYVWTYKAPPEVAAELRREGTLVAHAAQSELWRLERTKSSRASSAPVEKP